MNFKSLVVSATAIFYLAACNGTSSKAETTLAPGITCYVNTYSDARTDTVQCMKVENPTPARFQ
jgi:hypothetical protein